MEDVINIFLPSGWRHRFCSNQFCYIALISSVPSTYCWYCTVRLGMQTLSVPHSFSMEMESDVIFSNCPSTGISSLRSLDGEAATLEPVSE